MTFLQTVIAFLIALSILVAFHELGHYTAARLCGVRVLRFSLGIGKILWSRRFGKDGTEWALSMFPVGGYVKLLDARDADAPPMTEEDRKHEFTSQNVWKRIAIVAAGPFANFLLAVIFLTGLFIIGTPEPAAKIRAVPEATAAYAAGLRGGEKITAVDGEAVANWQQLKWKITDAVTAEHDAAVLSYSEGGTEKQAVLKLAEASADLDDSNFAERLGISLFIPPAVIESIEEGSPAEAAGIKPGETITGMNGKPMADALALILAVRDAPGMPSEFEISGRDGVRKAVITPQAVPEKNAVIGRIGIRLSMMPEMTVTRLGPLAAAAEGVKKTWETSVLTVRMICKMAAGRVSVKHISGPLAIADFAGQSAKAGFFRYMHFLVFISISLGIMNLLPIPVLDGGLLLYYAVELATGRPVPEKLAGIGYKIGMGLLGALFLVAVFNDIVRLFF